MLLLWRTDGTPLTPTESVVGSFQVLQASTGADFASSAAGDEGFVVDDQQAAYATFSATEDGETIGVAMTLGGPAAIVDDLSLSQLVGLVRLPSTNLSLAL